MTDSTSVATYTTTSRFTNSYFIRAMRVVWWFVAILGILFFIYMLPINFDIYSRMPSDVGSSAILDSQLSEQFLEGLSILQISPSVYAGFKIFIGFFIMSVSYGISYLIFRSRFDERIGMITAFTFVGLGAFIGFFSNYIPESQTAEAVLNFFGFMIAIVGWGSFYLFIVLYPDGRFRPWWSIISPIAWLASILVSFFPELGLDIFSDTYTGPQIFSVIWLFLAFGLPLIAQIYRYFRVFNTLQRQQVKWFLFALAILFIDIFFLQPLWQNLDPSQPVNVVITDFLNGVVGLLFLLLPLAVGMAILRYRLWDIDLVINKSLVYGLFLALAIGIFMLILVAIQVIIGQSQPLTALIIAGVFSAMLFRPAQKRIQNFVDRRIYRFNFDLNELAAAQKIREITTPGALTGKTLSGYEVGNLIGKGGMGEIYVGFKDNQTVAIKTLLPELAEDQELLVRFQREAETGQNLEHRYIAKVFGSGAVDGTPYLVMEYIEGQDLRSLLKRNGAFDEETTYQIIKNVCEALTIAHAEGVVHRDLKPANIMLRNNGEAVLMDFGISKVKDAGTITGTGAIGTIDYMAPEQIMSARTVDFRADIYALGIVTFELLTGERPFSGGAAQILFAHIQQPAPYACDVNPEIPTHIADAIQKAMAKEPEKRFNSAMEFSSAMQA